MKTFLALYDTFDREIKAKGYARQELSDLWSLEPGTMTFSNPSDIVFGPTLKDWPVVSGYALVDENGDRYMPVMPGARCRPLKGEHLRLPAGKLTFHLFELKAVRP